MYLNGAGNMITIYGPPDVPPAAVMAVDARGDNGQAMPRFVESAPSLLGVSTQSQHFDYWRAVVVYIDL